MVLNTKVAKKFSSVFHRLKYSLKSLLTKIKRVANNLGPLLNSFWKKIKTFFYLVWLNLVVQKRNFIEWLRVIFRYYSRTSFLKTDLLLLFYYLFRNPFRMSKKFLIAKGEEDVYAYGETPLTTLDTIMSVCGVTEADTVFELGSGRGRGCFWMESFKGCKVVGVEWLPDFVSIAEKVRAKRGIEKVSFRLGDMSEMDFSGATVIYLYGTCLDEEVISKLAKRLESVPAGTKVITVSYSLLDYVEDLKFEVMKLFSARFTWGDASVYVHYKK